MGADDVAVERSSGRCTACGAPIEPGQEFHSAIFEQREGFGRKDYCPACWSGPPPEAYCHFRTRRPAHAEKRRLLIDDEALVAFFLRLGEEGEVAALKADFRFVLMLILLRKRILRYEQTRRADGAEYWRVRLVRDQSFHDVLDPHLNEARIELLTGELNAILAEHVAAADEPAAAPPADEPLHA